MYVPSADASLVNVQGFVGVAPHRKQCASKHQTRDLFKTAAVHKGSMFQQEEV